MALKNSLVAYLLLLIGGVFGFHLLYLRRDKQAFLYWCTLGGFFGLGCLRDFFKIPAYVREANFDSEFSSKLAEQKRIIEKPPHSFTKYGASAVMSSYFSALLVSAFPKDPVYGFDLFPLSAYLKPFAGAVVVMSLWTSSIYFNGEFTDKNGHTVKIKDMLHYFVNSPMYLEFKRSIWDVLIDFKNNGPSSAWNKLLDRIDVTGERAALKVLGLQKGARQEQIVGTFKRLSRLWHPDKHKDPELKKIAEQKFMEIANAYEKLSDIKKKRQIRNQADWKGEL